MITVSANHIDPKWQLNEVQFASTVDGEWDQQYRVGYTGVEDDRRFYAIATNFGCGRNRRTAKQAIEDLLLANGCSNIRITL